MSSCPVPIPYIRLFYGCGCFCCSTVLIGFTCPVYRFIGVWQQESGKGPQIANGAVDCVPDLTSHASPPPWRALLGRPDPLGSRLLTNPSAGEPGVGGERVVVVGHRKQVNGGTQLPVTTIRVFSPIFRNFYLKKNKKTMIWGPPRGLLHERGNVLLDLSSYRRRGSIGQHDSLLLRDCSGARPFLIIFVIII